MSNEIVTFVNGDMTLAVDLSLEEKTVWLTLDQMAVLFQKTRTNISQHIQHIFAEKELIAATSVRKIDRSIKKASRPPLYYNLDVIISVGYRVHSNNGVVFRKWATKILNDYLIKGYSVNQKRLEALQRTVTVQNALLGSISEKAGMDSEEVLSVVKAYEKALFTLDGYDHGDLSKPKTAPANKVSYISCEDAKKVIKASCFSARHDLFGKEKEPGHLEGILEQIKQNVFGKELYPSVEEKAANLLYFVDKDHVFADGNKRIAAILFLEFLRRNGSLLKKDGTLRISNDALASLTLLIAESDPKEKEVMVAITMNFLLA